MFRNTIVPFAVGAVVGFLVHVWMTGQAQHPLPSLVSVTTEATPDPAPPPPAPLPIKNGPVLRKLQITGTVDQVAPRRHDEEPPQQQQEEEAEEQPHSVTISLDESLLGELEQNRDRLHDVAYAETTSEGWRIHVLREDNLMERTGLRDGDLVTYQGLNEQLQRSGRYELAERVAAFLNDLRR